MFSERKHIVTDEYTRLQFIHEKFAIFSKTVSLVTVLGGFRESHLNKTGKNERIQCACLKFCPIRTTETGKKFNQCALLATQFEHTNLLVR